MHTEILSIEQIEILPYLKKFKSSFYLVGGTAIAFHLGHRRSIDFELFTNIDLKKSRIKKALLEIPFKQAPIFEDYDQLHLIINQVKVTFFCYPYTIEHPIKVDSVISIPSLLTLAAMKAFALGRRSKWKDYVDLYFIIRDFYSIAEISAIAIRIFPQQFSEKLFRQQLAFHNDIDYTEAVEFLVEPVSDAQIKEFLVNVAIDIL
jgi:hypothetical protein